MCICICLKICNIDSFTGLKTKKEEKKKAILYLFSTTTESSQCILKIYLMILWYQKWKWDQKTRLKVCIEQGYVYLLNSIPWMQLPSPRPPDQSVTCRWKEAPPEKMNTFFQHLVLSQYLLQTILQAWLVSCTPSWPHAPPQQVCLLRTQP